MITREVKTIAVSPDRIWEFLGDPSRMPEYNPKCIRVDAMFGSVWGSGSTFQAVYRMGKNESTCDARIERYTPERAIEFRYEVGPPLDGVVLESYRLDGNREQTVVTHEVDMSAAGFPWWVRGVIWFIHRFGKPAGDGPLDHLARCLEAEEAEACGV